MNITIRLFESDTRHEVFEIKWLPVDVTSNNICFVDADCEAYATPFLDHFNFTKYCRGKINKVLS